MNIDDTLNGVYESYDAFIHYKNGLIHRESGPAVIFKNKNRGKRWWLNGVQIDVNNQQDFERILRLKEFL